MDPDTIVLTGYETFDITYNKSTKVLTFETPLGDHYTVNLDGSVSELRKNGMQTEVSNSGVISGTDGAGQTMTGPIFTPVKFIKNENDFVTMSFPGELTISSHVTNGLRTIKSRSGQRDIDALLNYEGNYKVSKRKDMINAAGVLTVTEEDSTDVYSPDGSITITQLNGDTITSLVSGDTRTTTDSDGNEIAFSKTTGLSMTFGDLVFMRDLDGIETLSIAGTVITQSDVEANQQATTVSSGSTSSSGPQP